MHGPLLESTRHNNVTCNKHNTTILRKCVHILDTLIRLKINSFSRPHSLSGLSIFKTIVSLLMLNNNIYISSALESIRLMTKKLIITLYLMFELKKNKKLISHKNVSLLN